MKINNHFLEVPKNPRNLGVGSVKGKVIFKDDFKMTDNELISLHK
jgi:hypothetical protein